jgi:hypothetical protein
VEGVFWGRGCTRSIERYGASIGDISQSAIKFESCSDVSYGGVLFSLPAIISNGLFYKCEEYFQLPNGYYGLNSILVILSFLVLLRIKSIEGVRYLPPGELGKVVGLDRIPEVKTLREKVGKLSDSGNVDKWHNDLSRYWMEQSPELSGYLYIDGHVRVYHGKKTKLPRRYVSRERLCLRGMTDYWVNDALGQPFFVLTTALTSGLLKMLRSEIIPRLLKDVPNQPSEDALNKDPNLHRFVILFDREGYSPDFFEEMFLKYRISCITYHKNPKEDWPVDEFEETEAILRNGERIEMKIAERKSLLSDTFWIREIRKLTKSGHQTTILSTDYKSNKGEIAAAIFKRWSQENFFKYMLQHFGIDRLIEYETEPIAETAQVVNPLYRKLNNDIKRHNSERSKLLKKFASKTLKEIDEPKKVKDFESKMAELREKIKEEENIIENLKKERKKEPNHIMFKELPEEDKFRQLATDKKHFIDTVKMIAYRAETALANIIRTEMARKDEARSVLRQIFNRDANIIPDVKNKRLIVELHNLTSEYEDKLALIICDVLNDTKTIFPGTDLKLFYKLVSEKNLRCQEV